jgi:hypothetical protein
MKSIAQMLLVGAVAIVAIAVSAAPSEAAKKKAAPKACTPGTACVSKAGVRHFCDGSGKMVAVLLPACSGANCGPAPKC